MNREEMCLLLLCLAMLIWCAVPVIRAFWHEIRKENAPLWYRYKPTGKVLYFPAHYESEAVGALLRDLKEIPMGVPFDSPDFERLTEAPCDAH